MNTTNEKINIKKEEFAKLSSSIKLDCEEMSSHLQDIQTTAKILMLSLNNLNHPDFFEKYLPIYRSLNKIHMKLLEQNCFFELFLLKYKKYISNIDNRLSLKNKIRSVKNSENNKNESVTYLKKHNNESLDIQNIEDDIVQHVDLQEKANEVSEKLTREENELVEKITKHDKEDESVKAFNTHNTEVKTEMIENVHLFDTCSDLKTQRNVFLDDLEKCNSDDIDQVSSVRNIKEGTVEVLQVEDKANATDQKLKAQEKDFDDNEYETVQVFNMQNIRDDIEVLKIQDSSNVINQKLKTQENELTDYLEKCDKEEDCVEQELKLQKDECTGYLEKDDERGETRNAFITQNVEDEKNVSVASSALRTKANKFVENLEESDKVQNNQNKPSISQVDEDVTIYISGERYNVTLNENSILNCSPDITSNKPQVISKYDDEKEELFNLFDMNRNTSCDMDIQQTLNKILKRIEEKNAIQIPDLRPNKIIERSKMAPNTNDQITKSSMKKASFNNSEINKTTTIQVAKLAYTGIVPKQGATPAVGDMCFISCVNDPLHFYIHVVREGNELIDYLSEQIAEFLEFCVSYKTKKEVLENVDYCVCYIDQVKNWYRGSIIKNNVEDANNVLVHLIDHGFTYSVPVKYVRKPHPYLFILPVMAEKCQLFGVKPLDNLTEWSEKSIRYFRTLVCEDPNQLFTIRYAEKTEESLIIDLQCPIIKSVAFEMIHSGNASEILFNKFMKRQILQAQGLTENDFKMTEEEKWEEYLNRDDRIPENGNVAVYHYDPIDEKIACKQFQRKGHCFKGSQCRFSHKALNPDGWTTDKESIYINAFCEIELPAPGTDIVVKLLSIINLRTFYLAIRKPQCLPNKSIMAVSTMKGLVNFMNKREEVNTFEIPTVIPAISEIILTKYCELWQRGRVIDIKEYANKVELQVFLVDFGITITANMVDTRKIKAKYLSFPFQAILSTLGNVFLKEDMTEKENDLGSDYLVRNLLNKKLAATVQSASSKILNILLYDEDGNDVGKKFVIAGIAHQSTISLSPAENCRLVVD